MTRQEKLLERFNERIGLKINHWTLIEYRYTKKKHPVYLCSCSCGTLKEVTFISKYKLSSKSCGCKRFEKSIYNHRPSPLEQLNVYSTIFNRYKRDAKERMFQFLLTYEEFESLVTKDCFYCGKEPLNEQWYNNRLKIKYNGIDRVNNKLCYNIKNCVTCCQKCNEVKKAVSPEIIEKAYHFLFGDKNV